ncbi:hypothetical protein ACHAW6_000141 [Cyclotella cf. meneghiniana]
MYIARTSWSISLSIGQNEELMIRTCGGLLSNMLLGFTIMSQTDNWVFLHWNKYQDQG